jgi:hypothetical protein
MKHKGFAPVRLKFVNSTEENTIAEKIQTEWKCACPIVEFRKFLNF